MNPIPLTAPNGRLYTYACGRCHHIPSMGSMLVVIPTFPDHEDIAYRLRDAERCCRCMSCHAPFGDDDRRCGDCETCDNWNAFRWSWRAVAVCIEQELASEADYHSYNDDMWRDEDDE